MKIFICKLRMCWKGCNTAVLQIWGRTFI